MKDQERKRISEKVLANANALEFIQTRPDSCPPKASMRFLFIINPIFYTKFLLYFLTRWSPAYSPTIISSNKDPLGRTDLQVGSNKLKENGQKDHLELKQVLHKLTRMITALGLMPNNHLIFLFKAQG